MAHKNKLIVKVQLPLATTGDPNECLVYNEDRSIEGQFPAPKGLRARMMEGDGATWGYEGMKNFFYASTDDDGYLVLLKVAPWQDW